MCKERGDTAGAPAEPERIVQLALGRPLCRRFAGHCHCRACGLCVRTGTLLVGCWDGMEVPSTRFLTGRSAQGLAECLRMTAPRSAGLQCCCRTILNGVLCGGTGAGAHRFHIWRQDTRGGGMTAGPRAGSVESDYNCARVRDGGLDKKYSGVVDEKLHTFTLFRSLWQSINN